MNIKNLISFIILTTLTTFFYWLNGLNGVLNLIVSVGTYCIIFYLFHIIWKKIRKQEISDSKIFIEKFLFNISILISVLFLILGLASYLSNEIYPAKMPEITISNGKKIVKFQTMVHIGKKRFYEEIIENLRNFKKKGGVYFFEGVKPGTPENNKKFNKALGFKFDKDLYKNFSKLYGVSFQDNAIFLGIENNLDFNVDISLDEIIKLYEGEKIEKKPKNDEIVDLNNEIIKTLSKLNSKELKILNYLNQAILNRIISNENIQEKLSDNFGNKELFDIILNKRNEKLVEEIIKSDYKKIFITYGLLHFKGVFKILKENDKNWKILEKKDLFPIK